MYTASDTGGFFHLSSCRKGAAGRSDAQERHIRGHGFQSHSCFRLLSTVVCHWEHREGKKKKEQYAKTIHLKLKLILESWGKSA